jgi:hypothetical protein
MTAPKNTRTPGPKPDYLVVEDHLKCQTSEGEISLDLRIPLDRIELFMDMGDLDIEQKKLPRYMIDNILWPEDKSTIVGMRDGAKALTIVSKFAETLGERMGATMGESSGSTELSENTVEPSDTTSDTASE